LFWVLFQFFMVITDMGGEVSWAAHVGGIIAGAVLVLIFRRSGVPLFDRTIDTPRAVVRKNPEPVAATTIPASPPPKWGR
jgi:multisubunit Na+/H+ antiporter MnhE subunit